ncbi:beta-L-arabinofuranosidase domain-containing protein [Timonella senegalensis]|uniref:beta-L-arabinofuranosidase domain-containing protein n=1 Tax=Timonella senegalensis TaxID=1465825 RepID=UPI002FDCC992
MLAFPLSAVTLTDGPFRTAQDTGLTYVLSLDPDRLLSPVLREAGLQPRARSYGNWEDSGLDGHTLGHVLSAFSAHWAATRDERALERLTYLVAEIARAQAHLGTGYVGGVPHGVELWEQIAGGNVEPDSFGLNGAWVPWYNLHKLFAGLIDAHRIAGSALALEVVTRLADSWVDIARPMSDEQFEAMLRTEFGAMNASYADLFELTGNPEYAVMSKRFTDLALFSPLAAGEHPLPGMHANTQIAKAFGYARVARTSNDPAYLGAARAAWSLVANRHTFAFGGNSMREHFTAALGEAFGSEQGPETCNTYNMLRLTTELLAAPQPGGAPSSGNGILLDFYERAMFNHILSSTHPETGGLVYFTPVRPDHYRVYSQSQECFWCCVGTGMENHARYGELIYGREGDAITVNLQVASRLRADDLDLELEQLTTALTSDSIEIVIHRAPATPVNIAVRIPWWAEESGSSSSTVRTFSRTWQPGDRVSIPLTKRLTTHTTPAAHRAAEGAGTSAIVENLEWVAFQHGPAVLAARGGQQELDGLISDDSRMGHVASGPLHPLAETPIVFDVDSAVLSEDGNEVSVTAADGRTVELEPFWQLHDARYTMYFPLASDQTPADVLDVLERVDRATPQLSANLIDQIAAGEQQPESDHGFTGTDSAARADGTIRWREATGHFEYTLRTGGKVPGSLVIVASQQETASAVRVVLGGSGAQGIAEGGTEGGTEGGADVGVISMEARALESEPAREFTFDLTDVATRWAGASELSIRFESVGCSAEVPAEGRAEEPAEEPAEGSGLTPRIHGIRLLR